MPYITEKQRQALDKGLPPLEAGELNYLITRLILEYIKDKGESYSVYNAVMGVLECVKHEIYRRLISSYEDKKRKENGDIFKF